MSEPVPTIAADQRASAPLPTEWLARVFIAVALAALFYAVWMVNLPGAAGWAVRGLRVLPRVSTFALGVILMLFVQGPRPKILDDSEGTQQHRPVFSNRFLLIGALVLGALVLMMQDSAGQFEIQRVAASNIGDLREAAAKSGAWAESANNVWFHARPGYFALGALSLLARFECALFAAIFLGTWAGRGARASWHFLALILCAAISDAWLNAFRIPDVPDIADASHVLSALRMPFFPSLAGFNVSPALTDLFFAAAVLEAARVLRMHPASLALGAVAGYCSAAFLALEPLPGISVLSMTLMGSGVMAGAWPDLKLNSTAIGKAFLTAALMVLTLSFFTSLQRRLAPPPKPIQFPERIRNVA